MKNKYFFARFWKLTMVLTILTQFLVIFISKTRGLLLKFFFADDFNSPSPITSIYRHYIGCLKKKKTPTGVEVSIVNALYSLRITDYLFKSYSWLQKKKRETKIFLM
jgi:hypothetical protein